MEDAPQSGLDVGSTDEDASCGGIMAQPFEVDALQQLPQWVVVGRIGLIGRPYARQHLRREENRIVIEAPIALRAKGPEARVAAQTANILPIAPQILLRLRCAAAEQAIGENSSIHGPGAGAADAHDFEAR